MPKIQESGRSCGNFDDQRCNAIVEDELATKIWQSLKTSLKIMLFMDRHYLIDARHYKRIDACLNYKEKHFLIHGVSSPLGLELAYLPDFLEPLGLLLQQGFTCYS